ncbi:uncharacterized protein [Physcomitrium patens]|uniref:Uncharacterized protein n=2 Tax=Physcomitrium patens TaxID=3218 RepID=A0A2K1J7K8_PHYPA|nr:uncharacterized protein LOC112293636 isoform X1 [Physcomitrium patens]XP_024399065.1 uncharacterized protein LOC112293636 isoform X1 [Physcomitrium patens]PNR37514.1 hypothetical protein PHYPA_020623 [Physcomitrium patens]|eukprot:XP_024399064.1 uncharacterized protein LOC112293636 isoform X1 [Physcomitrella patens]
MEVPCGLFSSNYNMKKLYYFELEIVYLVIGSALGYGFAQWRDSLTPKCGRQLREVEKAAPMTRSEEGANSAPWIKMMQLTLNRRQQVPDKKISSVNETLNDGLVTFAMERQDSDDHKSQQILKPLPRRSYKFQPEPDSLSSPRRLDEAIRRAEFEQTFKEAANCEDETSNKSMGSNRRHHRRAASLDTRQRDTIVLGPILTTSLSLKENRKDPIPEKLTADDSTGKFAYISLDGRLINAELATSVTSIGGKLGDKEAQAWEDFAPMQRVLIVAVSAAAAAAAKQRNRKEIDTLLRTVENREKELVLLRQELSELCKQSNTHVNHPETLQLLENLVGRSISPKTPGQGGFAAMRRSFEGDNIKAKLDMNEAWSCTRPAISCRVDSELRGDDNGYERRLSRDSPVNKDVVFVERSPCKSVSALSSCPASDEVWTKEAKWYVNPMVETSQDFYDISTPERSNAMYSICNPAVEGTFEWRVLTSSFANNLSSERPSGVESPLLTPPQATISNNSGVYRSRSDVMGNGATHKEDKAMRALCAAVVLDLRKQMLTVLDKEASKVMAALDTSVEDAKTQVASMHLAVASCWNASVPKALAALSLSPSEFDSYLLNEVQGSTTWTDISKIEESILAWRQYLGTNYGAGKPLGGGEEKCSKYPNWSERTKSLYGADESLAPVRYPRYTGQSEDRNFGLRSGGIACPRNSTEDLAEQLLGELDKAAAKVTAMENQMKKLEQDAAGCDGAQSGRLSKYIERDLDNKVKGLEDFAELVRQIQYKEMEVADLKKSQQALVEAKNKEMEEMKEDFKRRDAELNKLLAETETTKAASEHRLATLEELCREKDSTLAYLKQDIQALESKVQKSKVYQYPGVPRSRRNSTSSAPSTSSGNGTSQRQRFSHKHAPYPSGHDPIQEHIGRFRREASSNTGRFRNLHINVQRHYDFTDDGRSEHGYDQETSLDYSSPPGSTIGDDCSVNSLAFSETEVESRLGSEYCSSGDDSRCRSTKDRLSGTKGPSYNRTLQKQKWVSSDLRRAVASTASSARGLARSESNRIYTSATSGSRTASGEKHPSKPLNRTPSAEIKKTISSQMRSPTVPNSPRNSSPTVPNSPRTRLGVVSASHRRASSLDMNYKSNFSAILETSGGSSDNRPLVSPEGSSIKRKRWV